MSPAPVSLHPYFKVHAGQLAAAEDLLTRFVEKTASEENVLWYEFTQDGDRIFCREGYRDAEATLAHLTNVGALLEEMLTLSELTRLEIHGPAVELARLRAPLAHLPIEWFEVIRRLERPSHT